MLDLLGAILADAVTKTLEFVTMTSIPTLTFSLYDLREIADAAQRRAEALDAGEASTYAQAVEDVLRCITGDAQPTGELIAATSGRINGEPHLEYDDTPAIFISRGQLNEFAGRNLSDSEVQRMVEAWPNSSIPEALSTMSHSLSN